MRPLVPKVGEHARRCLIVAIAIVGVVGSALGQNAPVFTYQGAVTTVSGQRVTSHRYGVTVDNFGMRQHLTGRVGDNVPGAFAITVVSPDNHAAGVGDLVAIGIVDSAAVGATIALRHIQLSNAAIAAGTVRVDLVLPGGIGVAVAAGAKEPVVPGNTSDFAFQVTNTGTAIDSFQLAATISDLTWSLSYPSRTGPVAPGVATTITMSVAVPANAHSGLEVLSVQACSLTNDLVCSYLSSATAIPSDIVSAPVPTTNLRQNRPNPFNPRTQITFELSAAGRAGLAVFDLRGCLVRELVPDLQLAAGRHTVEWDGKDQSGGTVGSGVYVYRLTTSAGSWARRMVLVR